MRMLVRLLLFTGCSIVAFREIVAQQSITAIRLNGFRFADQFSGVDIGAKVNAAIGDCGGDCTIIIPAGRYSFSTTMVINNAGTSLIGAGSAATILNYTGAGDALLWQMNPFTILQAGKLSGLTINGNWKAVNGVHSGSIVGAQFDDLHIENFTGPEGVGILLENASIAGTASWTERNLFTRIHLDNNMIGLRMIVTGGTDSFGYNRFLDLRLNVNGGQFGISAENNGVLYNATMIAMANVGASSGTVVSLKNTTVWKDSLFNLTAECTDCKDGTFIATATGTVFYPLGNLVGLFGLANSIAGKFQPVISPSPDPSIAAGGRPLYSTISSGGTNVTTSFLPTDLPPVASWLLANPRAAGDFLFGLGINVGWNTAGNWLTNGDRANNGGAAILGSNGGGILGFYMIPSTGGTPQNITNAQLATYRVATLDNSGNFVARGTIVGGGGDYAESVAVKGGHQMYEPGDVVVISEGTREFRLADRPYASNVAGIYSTKPGVIGSEHPFSGFASTSEIPLAIAGIVPCKVTAANGAIAPGDLLVTSSVPGEAMKGTKRPRMLGAVIGKALEPLPRGEGKILILLAVQ